mmetsp:Transcript_13409/g.28336  ORF Transcript_13409/g.28336 Transcript_13409/m.28336 type:complete len:236 (+) Transcript_13409:1956-2663(+)
MDFAPTPATPALAAFFFGEGDVSIFSEPMEPPEPPPRAIPPLFSRFCFFFSFFCPFPFASSSSCFASDSSASLSLSSLSSSSAAARARSSFTSAFTSAAFFRRLRLGPSLVVAFASTPSAPPSCSCSPLATSSSSSSIFALSAFPSGELPRASGDFLRLLPAPPPPKKKSKLCCCILAERFVLLLPKLVPPPLEVAVAVVVVVVAREVSDAPLRWERQAQGPTCCCCCCDRTPPL